MLAAVACARLIGGGIGGGEDTCDGVDEGSPRTRSTRALQRPGG